MEHTNYEIQVYLLLLLIFIIQTYIQACAQTFLFLLLKLSTNMFNSVFNFYWPVTERNMHRHYK